ncbi:SpoIID/LytB domain-containing protein [Lachnospiraceae bacterium 3-1]|nr:SpoIID/LytB domain-containing protein [Lachnospiraceae bacterium 3-1]
MEKKYSVKRKNLIAVAITMTALILVVLFISFMTEEKVIREYSDEYVAIAELPSQLDFTYFEELEWKEKLKEINTGRNLNGKLTYGKLKKLLQQLSVQEYITYKEKLPWIYVPRSEWNGVYEQILDLLDTEEKVSVENLMFLTKESEASEDGETLRRLTQKGYYSVAEGIDYFHTYDMYQVYVKNNRIIGINSEYKGSLTLENVFVHSTNQEQAEILYERQKITLDMDGLKENITDTICDIEWTDRKVSAIYKKEDMISGKVLSFNDEQIEISGYGTLPYSGPLKIYKTYGTVEELGKSKLVIGNLQADFVVAEKQVCGVILKEPASIEIIRVLLLNEEGGSYHKNPVFTADADGSVTVGDKTEQVKANQPIMVSELLKEDSDYVKVTLENEDGRIYFSDGNGAHTSLGYRGTFEVRKYEEGYGVVNEVSLEQYLYGVVPSEMPASYEREALCVQAVCARSYACIQLMKGDYAALGAHVDDSTSYQVYNKQEESIETNLAVDDTVGEVIKYQGEVAEAYFFSTSCGYTGDMGLWNLPEGEEYGYLQGISLVSEDAGTDISNEENFAAYIEDTQVTAFDSDSPYFRWQAEVAVTKESETIRNTIAERAKANPGNVQILKEDGSEGTDAELAGFGSVKEMSVGERGTGGGIRTLCISFEKGTVNLFTEYNVRYVLGAAAENLKNKNGESIDMRLLPSAYFTLVSGEEAYVLHGGGYGHGIGMSQNGANGMAKTGMNYVDILMKFYQNITIENIYNEE